MSEDLDVAAAQLNAALETLIRECPAQYLWSYERYRAPPGTEAPPQP
jgi:KDO2-lipid IV(A) lauroyltransferase